MAKCSICSAEIGNGGIVQESGALMCAACDGLADKPVMRLPAKPLRPIPPKADDADQLISPRFIPWATYWIAFANGIVFFVMVVYMGTAAGSPTADDLLLFGGNYGPLTVNEPWRLFTCQFVHAGPVHFLSNLYVLLSIGPLAEGLFGRRRFVLLYSLAGLGGVMLSLWWNPAVVSVGASGAIFGIVGALLAFFAQNSDGVKSEAISKKTNALLVFAGLNLFLGFKTPGIDNAGHIGGLGAGFLLGLMVSTPSPVLWREIAAMAVALAVCCAGFERIKWHTPHWSDLGAPIARRAYFDYQRKIQGHIRMQKHISRELSNHFLQGGSPVSRIDLLDQARASLLALQSVRVEINADIAELHALLLKTSEKAVDCAVALVEAPPDENSPELYEPFFRYRDAEVEMNKKIEEFEERNSGTRN